MQDSSITISHELGCSIEVVSPMESSGEANSTVITSSNKVSNGWSSSTVTSKDVYAIILYLVLQDITLQSTTITRKTVLRKAKKPKWPSRTSCHNCNAFVSSTSRRLRTTNKILCVCCYRKIKIEEESEKKINALNIRNEQLKRKLKTARNKMKRILNINEVKSCN